MSQLNIDNHYVGKYNKINPEIGTQDTKKNEWTNIVKIATRFNSLMVSTNVHIYNVSLTRILYTVIMRNIHSRETPGTQFILRL